MTCLATGALGPWFITSALCVLCNSCLACGCSVWALLSVGLLSVVAAWCGHCSAWALLGVGTRLLWERGADVGHGVMLRACWCNPETHA